MKGLTLCVDGRTLAPDGVVDGELLFRLELPARDIRLVSAAARPLDLGVNADTRRLGVRVWGMRFTQHGREAALAIAAAEFRRGFHRLEAGGYRWTDGDAAVPEGLVPSWTGQAELRLDVGGWDAAASPRAAGAASRVMDGFESLGSDCELAFVQRHFAASVPAGLLSWASLDLAGLRAGLDDGFARLDDADGLAVAWERDEYKATTPYFRMHTGRHLRGGDDTAAAIHAACAARLRLLRRKLLAEIAEARRVFVFTARHAGAASDRAGMAALSEALRRRGPARLLWVAEGARADGARADVADAARADGARAVAVERAGDGLYLATISRFVLGRGPYDEWRAICARVAALRRGDG